MKLLRLLMALLVLLSAAGVKSAIAGGVQIITVTNNTTYTMSEFYASPSDSSAWDTTNNLLAGLTILPGQTSTISVLAGNGNGNGAGSGDECDYDLMAVLYGAAQFAYRYQVDACSGATWTISP
jgi:hypothetical protein